MLKNINTEKRNPRSFNLDSMSVQESVNLMIDEEYGVIEALKEQSLNIAKIVEVTSQALKKAVESYM